MFLWKFKKEKKRKREGKIVKKEIFCDISILLKFEVENG